MIMIIKKIKKIGMRWKIGDFEKCIIKINKGYMEIFFKKKS